MKRLIRIVSTQEPTLLDIRFWPTDICNFSCNYCFPGSVLNKLRYPKNIDTVIKNFQFLFDFYVKNNNKTKFKINIVGGGEPTLWPHFKEFCEGIKSQHNVKIQLTTNGSRTVRWFQENTALVDEFVLSCHQKEVNIINFIDVADHLFSSGKDVTALMLMDASAWDRCIDLINEMKQSKEPWIIQAKEVVEAKSYDINSYSEEQLEYLKQPLKRVPGTEWILNNVHRFRIHESIAMYDDDTVIPATSNKYIVDRENIFTGWNCNVAIENLVITHDGTVTATCQQEIFQNVNINMFSDKFSEQFKKSSMHLRTIKCSLKSCSCQPDTHITKRIS